MIGEKTISEDDNKLFSGFSFLSTKPVIVIANTGEKDIDMAGLKNKANDYGINLVEFRGDMEMEISMLPENEQKEFLEDLGVTEGAKNRFLKEIYKKLNLISFITGKEDEVRAWSIPSGCNAVKAAGKIHTDLEKGFIRAEIIEWLDLLNSGGFKQAKSGGKLRLEGKDYTVKDGDVLTIRFNI